MNTEKTINMIFENLTDWSNIPKYQLERRIDIFFTPYLETIINHHYGEKGFHPDLIIPEFPLKKDCSNRSSNIDYFLCDFERAHICLLELKTNKKSFDPVQLRNMIDASLNDVAMIVNNIRKIKKTTRQKEKYKKLIEKIESISDQKRYLMDVVYIYPDKEIEDEYAQNSKDKYSVISFDCIAIILENIKNDLIAQKLCSLIKGISK
ncbi:MAG: hypothetical protein HQK52_23085 [Oligoflexia bacterium]|nr:hypothetical protein [Oligoflexia bacterium]